MEEVKMVHWKIFTNAKESIKQEKKEPKRHETCRKQTKSVDSDPIISIILNVNGLNNIIK